MDQECRGMTGGTCLCGEPVDHLQEILPAAAGGQGQPWTAERQRDAGPALAAADVLDQWAGHYLG